MMELSPERKGEGNSDGWCLFCQVGSNVLHQHKTSQFPKLAKYLSNRDNRGNV